LKIQLYEGKEFVMELRAQHQELSFKASTIVRQALVLPDMKKVHPILAAEMEWVRKEWVRRETTIG
jgi:hypothetical protein